MIFKDLAHELMNPLYCSERISYEDSKFPSGKTEKLVMIALHDQDYMYPSVLCRMVHASSPRMAVILKTLEERGWLTRTPDPDDFRKTIVRATPDGILAGTEFALAVEETMEEKLALMGEDDAREYVRLQKKFSEVLKKPKKVRRFSK